MTRDNQGRCGRTSGQSQCLSLQSARKALFFIPTKYYRVSLCLYQEYRLGLYIGVLQSLSDCIFMHSHSLSLPRTTESVFTSTEYYRVGLYLYKVLQSRSLSLQSTTESVFISTKYYTVGLYLYQVLESVLIF